MVRRGTGSFLVALTVAVGMTRAADPIAIEGPEQGQMDPELADGGLPPVVGVRNVQVFRASANRGIAADGKGYTYHHHVDMAAWKGRLYVAWNSCERDEDTWPSRELYSTSADGVRWSAPEELFPQGISTPLRMYFFCAPNGRMLAIAGLRVDRGPTSEKTKGPLVVREIRADHTLGRACTLQGPDGEARPSYRSAGNEGFVAACEALLANRPFLQQQDYGNLLPADRRMKWNDPANWAEALRADAEGFGKAMAFFHRKDGALVGVAKKGWVTVSADEGVTWSQPVMPETLVTGMAKVWGQRTPDGRYALVYNPDRKQRFPLVLVTSDDGVTFGGMRVVHGVVPAMRYEGQYKSAGPQYVRGISEWSSDGSWKDQGTWVAYSVNKEDIWVSRVPNGTPLPEWNTYSLKWGPADVRDGVVRLEDGDPADGPRATKVFEAAGKVRATFQAKGSGNGTLRAQWLAPAGAVGPVELKLDPASAHGEWIDGTLAVDCGAGTWSASMGGPAVSGKVPPGFASVGRLSFTVDDGPGVKSAEGDRPIERPTVFEIRQVKIVQQ